jgi:type VI secretion system protein ImpA
VSSAAVVDLEQLLAPVPGENPCGENLRWDPVYDEIKQGRREEDKDALGGGPTQANWELVISKASELLGQRSKDLMLAGYLLEALLQRHGFAGLRDGLKVVNALIESFWDSIYPEIEEDDLEPRAAPIAWFTDADRGARLPNRTREIAIVPGNAEGEAFSWSFWKSRYIQPKGESEDESAYAERQMQAEQRAKSFEDAVIASPLEHYAVLREDLEECKGELSRLNGLLDDKFGAAAPGTTGLKKALEECGILVDRIFKEKGGLDTAEAEGEAGSEATGEGTAQAAALSGPIKSRADATRRLAEVAAYFRQTEPHSPVSYLIERANSWVNMPLDQLLAELVKDTTTLDQIAELLGFRRVE